MKTKTFLVKTMVLALLTLSLGFGANMASAANTPLVIGTGGVAGAYYPAGGAIASLINRNGAATGIRIVVEPSMRASMDNVNGLLSGSLQLGLVQSDIQSNALNGKGAFANKPETNKLRVLFSLYSEAFTVVAGKDSGIRKFEDLKGKRIAMGDPGASFRETSEMFMREYGLTAADVKPAQGISAENMGAGLCSGEVDAFIYAIGHPYGMITKAVNECGAHIISLEGKELTAFTKSYAFYPPTLIPAGMYTGETQNIQTFGPKATVMVSSDLPDDTAYFITKTVFENFDAFKKMLPVFSELTKEDMLKGNSVPFHPGAMRYFKEAGLLQ